MKYNAIKIISITMMLILLLGALSSCGNRISVSKKEKIEKAFREQKEIELELSLNEKGEIVDCGYMEYYGVFDEAYVFFSPSMMCAVETKTVAKQRITYPYCFNIWIYKNGKVYTIEDAYEKRVLSKWTVTNIARAHYKYWILKDSVERDDRSYYGTYGKCDVAFVEFWSPNPKEHTLTVAGYEFKNQYEFSIWAYADGDRRSLEWLYENGYLSKKDVGEIYKIHTEIQE